MDWACAGCESTRATTTLFTRYLLDRPPHRASARSAAASALVTVSHSFPSRVPHTCSLTERHPTATATAPLRVQTSKHADFQVKALLVVLLPQLWQEAS